jgi:hypothetical protein
MAASKDYSSERAAFGKSACGVPKGLDAMLIANEQVPPDQAAKVLGLEQIFGYPEGGSQFPRPAPGLSASTYR